MGRIGANVQPASPNCIQGQPEGESGKSFSNLALMRLRQIDKTHSPDDPESGFDEREMVEAGGIENYPATKLNLKNIATLAVKLLIFKKVPVPSRSVTFRYVPPSTAQSGPYLVLGS